MFYRLVLPLALLVALVGCSKKKTDDASHDAAAHEDHDHGAADDEEGYVPSMSGTPAPALDPGETRSFGEEFDAADALDLSTLLATCVDSEDYCVVDTGVGASCTHSGCWFTLVAPDNEDMVLVEIEDETFTMPKNAAASDIVAQGKLTRTHFSQNQSHYFRSEAARQLGQDAPDKASAPTEGFLFTINGAEISKSEDAPVHEDSDDAHHDHHDHDAHGDHDAH